MATRRTGGPTWTLLGALTAWTLAACTLATCTPPAATNCDPGARRCRGGDDRSVLECAADGRTWLAAEPCAPDEWCAGGLCVARRGSDTARETAIAPGATTGVPSPPTAPGATTGEASAVEPETPAAPGATADEPGAPTASDTAPPPGLTGALSVVATFDVPGFRTGVPSVFTDLHVSTPRLYLVNDGQNCEVVLKAGRPSFKPPTFCAASRPGYQLRGWTRHRNRDHIVNLLSRTVVAGDGFQHPLPAALREPSGLASDGERLWVADGGGNALFAIGPEGEQPRRLPGPGRRVDSVSWDGTHLWVLDGRTVHLLDPSGQPAGGYTVPVDLSGISVNGADVWGTAAGEARLYKLARPAAAR